MENLSETPESQNNISNTSLPESAGEPQIQNQRQLIFKEETPQRLIVDRSNLTGENTFFSARTSTPRSRTNPPRTLLTLPLSTDINDNFSGIPEFDRITDNDDKVDLRQKIVGFLMAAFSNLLNVCHESGKTHLFCCSMSQPPYFSTQLHEYFLSWQHNYSYLKILKDLYSRNRNFESIKTFFVMNY